MGVEGNIRSRNIRPKKMIQTQKPLGKRAFFEVKTRKKYISPAAVIIVTRAKIGFSRSLIPCSNLLEMSDMAAKRRAMVVPAVPHFRNSLFKVLLP
jgi:hypothetical protein